jgi:hypothetical protein
MDGSARFAPVEPDAPWSYTSRGRGLGLADAARAAVMDRSGGMDMAIGESQTKAPEMRARSWIDSWLPYKPNIDPAVQEELNHYSTDHLSRLYHEDVLGYIQLRNFIISPKELNEEVQRRLWLESVRFRVTIVLLSVAAVASVIAAFEGWRTR